MSKKPVVFQPYMRAADYVDEVWSEADAHTLAAGDWQISLWSRCCAVFYGDEIKARHLADDVKGAKEWVQNQLKTD